jgi:hypothetical protein
MYMSSGLSKRQTTAVGASFGNAGMVAGACGRTAVGLQFSTIFDNNLSYWFAERFRTILFNVLYNFVALCYLLTAHHRTTDQARQRRRRSLGRFSFSPARSRSYKHAATPFALLPTYLAKHHVLAVQPRRLGRADKELTAIGVRSGIGHGQRSGTAVHNLKVFVWKFASGVDGLTARAIAHRKVTPLRHKTGLYVCGAKWKCKRHDDE